MNLWDVSWKSFLHILVLSRTILTIEDNSCPSISTSQPLPLPTKDCSGKFQGTGYQGMTELVCILSCKCALIRILIPYLQWELVLWLSTRPNFSLEKCHKKRRQQLECTDREIKKHTAKKVHWNSRGKILFLKVVREQILFYFKTLYTSITLLKIFFDEYFAATMYF